MCIHLSSSLSLSLSFSFSLHAHVSICKRLIDICAHTWIYLAHASSNRENYAATYLSRLLCLRFYMRVMFCAKFPSGHPFVSSSVRLLHAGRRRGIALSLRESRAIDDAHSQLSCAGDSKESTVLDETDAPRRIIATLTSLTSSARYARSFAIVASPSSFLGIIEYRSRSFFSFLLLVLFVILLLFFRAS